MITVRAPQYVQLPPPPWLDPNQLGATRLKHVPAAALRVIDGGTDGLLAYLSSGHPQDERSEAFVLRCDDGAMYVYSREQFWIAAKLLLELVLRKHANFSLEDWTAQWHEVREPEALARNILDWSFPDADGLTLPRELGWAAFDVHEYAESEQLAPGQPPTRPAIERDHTGTILGAHVPDTGFLDTRRAVREEDEAQRRSNRLEADRIRKVEENYWLESAASSRKSSPSTGIRKVEEDYWLEAEPIRKAEEDNRLELDRVRMADENIFKRTAASPLGRDAEPETARAQPAIESIQRFPHLDVTPPGRAKPGQKLRVTVYADEIKAGPGVEQNPIIVQAPAAQKVVALDVWLMGTPHFVIPDGSQRIEITRGVADSSQASFDIEIATALPSGRPKLTAIFQYGGRPCGSVSSYPEIIGADASATAEERKRTVSRLAADPTARAADLTVVIGNPSGDGQTFTCRVTTPLIPELAAGHTEPWVLKQTAGALVADHFKHFTTGKMSEAQRIAQLRGAGIELFKSTPNHFKAAVWRIIDEGIPVRTISIVSDEPFIPWELMVPSRGGDLNRYDPLGVAYAVGRWTSDEYCLPAQTVRLTESWVFAPNYPGPTPTPLAKAAAEAQLVRGSVPGDLIQPAGFDGLEQAMEKGGRSVLHFVCHGSSAPSVAQEIYCEDSSKLSSSTLPGAVHTPTACAKARPFVFLNACEVGRLNPALVGVGGFAPTFISLGASCVVAPLWSVKDTLAHEVAKDFYLQTATNRKRPFAEIFQEIRARAYAPGTGEDTYAAYCFYGDPLAAQET